MRSTAAVFFLLLAGVAPAAAQSAEVSLTVGWSVFTNRNIGEFAPTFGSLPTPFDIRDGVRIGGRLSLNNWEFLGHELSYAYQRGGLETNSSDLGSFTIQNYYYNFVVHATPTDAPVRPFITAGGGFSTFFPPGTSSLSGRGDNRFGFNVGGGLKLKLGIMFGLRFDVRDHVTSRPFNLPNASGALHNVEYSAGFTLLL